ncbi:MAG TPA: VOC family protein [Candidatus Kapabacteria bacterium]|nr:VOC family protein [Candidatus Kapabacteria bacterium]
MMIKGITIGSIYVDNYEKALHFYRDIIGMGNFSPMNDHSCYLSLNDAQGIYLIGGCTFLDRQLSHTGCTLALEVSSVQAMFMHLKEHQCEIIHNEPIAMNEVDYWFQAKDTSGNIIEFIGKQ